jgi:very-short-patch-repair endonuclease
MFTGVFRAREAPVPVAGCGAEQVLWRLLRSRRLARYRFRRRCVIGPFIVDFVCPEHALVILLDREHRAFAAPEDSARVVLLERMGYRVLRIWRRELVARPREVLTEIEGALR